MIFIDKIEDFYQIYSSFINKTTKYNYNLLLKLLI